MPHCNAELFSFPSFDRRKIEASFSGGEVSSDGGVMVLRAADRRLGLVRALDAVIADPRDADLVTHRQVDLLRQRIYGLALGYEDLNDHAALRRDPLLAVAAGKLDPLGAQRRDPADRGQALAAAPTLNRLELGNSKTTRYHKIAHDPAALEATLLAMGVRALPRDTTEVVLDFDASDDRGGGGE